MRFEEDENWRTQALCRRMVVEGLAHPNWWDSRIDPGSDDERQQEKTRARQERHEKAKAICDQCRVKLQCRADTVLGEDEGVRFGVVLDDLPTGRRRAA
jgi:hypothetical protein